MESTSLRNHDAATRDTTGSPHPPGPMEPDLLAGLHRAELIHLLRSSGITGKLIRTIVEGPEENFGDWTNHLLSNGQLDHAAIDFIVVPALLDHGVSAQDIESLFGVFKIGAHLARYGPEAACSYVHAIIEAVQRRTAEAKGPPDLDTLIVRAVLDLLPTAGTWQGTPSSLLAALTTRVGEPLPLGWPRSASSLGKILARLAPRLAKAGIEIRSDKEPGGPRRRQITLRRVRDS